MESFFMGLKVTAIKEKQVEIELLFDYIHQEMAARHANKSAKQFNQFGVNPIVEKRYGEKSAIVMTIDFNTGDHAQLGHALHTYRKIMHHIAFMQPDGEIYLAPHGETLAEGMLRLLSSWAQREYVA